MPRLKLPQSPRARFAVVWVLVMCSAIGLALVEPPPPGAGLVRSGEPRPLPRIDPAMLWPDDPWRWAAVTLLAVAGLAVVLGRRAPTSPGGELMALRKVFRSKGAASYAPVACGVGDHWLDAGGWGGEENAARWISREMGPTYETEEPGYRLLAGVLDVGGASHLGWYWASLNDSVKDAYGADGVLDEDAPRVREFLASTRGKLGHGFGNHYARTVCLTALAEARKTHRIPVPELSWVAAFDPELHHALSGLGRPSVHPSALGPLDHHAHEAVAFQALSTPQVANAAKAVAGRPPGSGSMLRTA